MSEFTPGPWQIDGHAIEAARSVVCIMGEIDGFESGYKACENSKANARLIAASPELLAACEAALEEYDGWKHLLPPTGARMIRCSTPIADKLRAAIILATADRSPA